MSSQQVLARRLTQLPPSVLHAVHREVEVAAFAGQEVFPLHIGEPAFRAPAAAVEAVASAVRDGHTDYTSAEGLPALRERLTEQLRQRSGVSTTPSRVLVTPGSSVGLVMVLLAVCRPGDDILLPEILWPIYAQAAAAAHLRVVTYPLRPDHSVDPDGFLRAFTPSTSLAVVNSPANPTGALCDPSVLHQLLEAARRHDAWLIGDEAYEHFVYQGRHVALASLEREVPEHERRVFSLHTFSKGYGMTGYRMGYVAAPSDASATAVCRVAEGALIAPSTPIQYGALAALDDEEMPARARAHVLATRNAALAGATEVGLLDHLPPAGWYALLDTRVAGLGSTDFARRLLDEEAVATTPGETFVNRAAGDPHCVRVAFCGDRAMTCEAMRRVCNFVERQRTMVESAATSQEV